MHGFPTLEQALRPLTQRDIHPTTYCGHEVAYLRQHRFDDGGDVVFLNGLVKHVDDPVEFFKLACRLDAEVKYNHKSKFRGSRLKSNVN